MKHNIITYIAITVFALSGIIFWETGFVWLVLIAIIMSYFIIVSYGSFRIQSNYFLKSINQVGKKGVALTFDDGPDPDTTPRILDILKEKNLQATFFVIGKKAEKYPEILRRMDEEGHCIGNHSFRHSYLIGFFSKSRLKEEFEKCAEAVYSITGKKPLYFRPPFGVTNPNYAAVAKELGISCIGWSLRSLDTQAKNKYQLINRILPNLKKRDIVLLHDNLSVTAESLEDIIEHCLEKGIRIEPLHKLIRNEPYEQI